MQGFIFSLRIFDVFQSCNFCLDKRRLMPMDILVYANQSLQSIIMNNDRDIDHTVYVVRTTVTDPLHQHNMTKDGKNIIPRFYQIPVDHIQESGLYSSKDRREIKDAYNFHRAAGVYQGDQECINGICRLLVYVLNQSEAQLRNNYNRGCSEETEGFKCKPPLYLNLNPSGTKEVVQRTPRKKKVIQQPSSGEENVRDSSPIRE